jgi:hypothetical protein
MSADRTYSDARLRALFRRDARNARWHGIRWQVEADISSAEVLSVAAEGDRHELVPHDGGTRRARVQQ